jgi:hypothetical protein
MKVDRVSTVGSAPLRRSERARSTDPGAFSRILTSEADTAAAVSGSGAPAPVDALLALQEVPDALTGRRQAQRHGEDLLDQLEELHLALVLGRLPAAMIERLTALAASQRERVEDPRLAEILNEIEVRAAVELAKLGRFGTF